MEQQTFLKKCLVKSDDVTGRSSAYRAIVNGKKIRLPESFKVLLKEKVSCIEYMT